LKEFSTEKTRLRGYYFDELARRLADASPCAGEGAQAACRCPVQRRSIASAASSETFAYV